MHQLTQIGKRTRLRGRSIPYQKMTARERAGLVADLLDGEKELVSLTAKQLADLLRVSLASVGRERQRRRQRNGHLIPLPDFNIMPERVSA